MTSLGITLRPLRPADLPAVVALHVLSFGMLGRAYTAAQRAAHARLVEAPEYLPDLLRSDLWLAEREGQLLGTAGWLEQGVGEGRIRKVFIHPDAARQGLATRLVTAAEQRARAAGCRRFVLRGYLDAVPLYRKLGYVDDHAGTMDLPDGLTMPVLFMRKGA